MTAFTHLELAALHSIFSETPELAPQLERQLSVATVSKRENTGVGFFTKANVRFPPIADIRTPGHSSIMNIAALAVGGLAVLVTARGFMNGSATRDGEGLRRDEEPLAYWFVMVAGAA